LNQILGLRQRILICILICVMPLLKKDLNRFESVTIQLIGNGIYGLNINFDSFELLYISPITAHEYLLGIKYFAFN